MDDLRAPPALRSPAPPATVAASALSPLEASTTLSPHAPSNSSFSLQPASLEHASLSGADLDFGTSSHARSDLLQAHSQAHPGDQRRLAALSRRARRTVIDRIGGDRKLTREAKAVVIAALVAALALVIVVSVLLASTTTNTAPIRVAAVRSLFWNGSIAIGPVENGLRATALAVDVNGRVVWHNARPSEEAAAMQWALAASAGQVVDLQGAFVLPGFIDAHMHPVQAGLGLLHCPLFGLASVNALLAKVASCAAALPTPPPGGRVWLIGAGWDVTLFPGANPSKSLLDGVTLIPTVLWASDGHSAWLSSSALAAANITASTPDPPDGTIARVPGTMEPSGILRENAPALVEAVLPPPTEAELDRALALALPIAHAAGLTTLFDARLSLAYADTYARAARAGTLTARVVAALSWAGIADDGPTDWDSEPSVAAHAAFLAATAARVNAAGGDLERLNVTTAKLFADGVLESQTAAVLSSYLDPATGLETGDLGMLTYTDAQLVRVLTALDSAGLQLHVHAIGDRAIAQTLRAYAAVRAAGGLGPDRLPAIAHVELVDPADVPRFAALGVRANWQPYWFVADAAVTELTLPYVGPERGGRLYPIHDLADAGASMACGSDWAVSSLAPLEGITRAVTRSLGPGLPPFIPAQRMPLAAMLRCYTADNAAAIGRAAGEGVLEVGAFGDLVVLDRDILAAGAALPNTATVLRTVVGGVTVFEK